MNIFIEEMSKLKNFFFMLFSLYLLNIFFNYIFFWGGVSVIVRVYIFVLSFYIVFLFSQLDKTELKEKFRLAHRKSGVLRLFVEIRVLPFFTIYLMTWIYTFINYRVDENWPLFPFFRILDGRFSNTLFYCLILLYIIRQNRRPRISIPQFIVYSMLFFMIDTSLYRYLNPGYGVGGIKFFKYMLFSFFMFWEFSEKRQKIFPDLLAAFVFAIISFSGIIFVYGSFYHLTQRHSFAHRASALMLLKSGCSLPMEDISFFVKNTLPSEKLDTILKYSHIYDRNINLSLKEWDDVLKKQSMAGVEGAFTYFNRKGVVYDFGDFCKLLFKFSNSEKNNLFAARALRRYFVDHVNDNWKYFLLVYDRANSQLRMWFLNALGTRHIPKRRRAVIVTLRRP